jgi:dienelactone hydrolase
LLTADAERDVAGCHATMRNHGMMIKNDLLCVTFTASLVAALVFIKPAFAADPIYLEAEAVEFESASYTYTPSPFKVRQAKKLGIPVEIKTEPAISLSGYLAKPLAEEPRAAIVLLHTCNGLSEHEEMWSKRLVDWGYVVLSVDSFTARGLDYTCDGRVGHYVGPWARALDAYGAKQYLSTRSFVDSARIAVMGMSHGGNTVLETIKQSISEGLAMKPFHAAIAYYPHCGKPESINAPTLILTQNEISLKVFADAYHAFDHPGIDIVELGYIVRSNPEAAAEARQITREFLDEWL